MRTINRTTVALLLLAALSVTGAAQGVIINECFTGAPDWAEITNTSGAPVNIGGWTIHMADDPTTITSFTFPLGTVIAAGGFIVVSDAGTGPSVPLGTQVFVTANINWAGPTSPNDPEGACALNDGSGVGVDYVAFGAPSNLPPGSPLSPFNGTLTVADAYARNSFTDTDNASDWTGSTGPGSPGAPNPGQGGGAPTAAFGASMTSILVGGSVTFTDLSTGGPTSWIWDLDGDGSTDSTAQNPIFVYNTPGSYDVSLTATNASGSDSLTLSNLITVNVAISATVPYAQDFDSGPLGGEFSLFSELGGRIIIGNDGNVSPLSGGDGLIMDSTTSSNLVTNTATLTIDLASAGGGTLLYYYRETNDEDHAEDGVFLSDGTTIAQISSHQGAFANWTELSVNLGQAAIANGISLTTSNQIIFSQRDTHPVPTDGSFFDDIRIDLPPVPDTGQPNRSLARLDVNNGTNLNGTGAAIGENGPFFASGNTLDITVGGQPNQAYILLYSVNLMRANASFGAVGQLDVGNLGMSDLSDIQILLNGATGGSIFDQLAVTNGSGTSEISLGLAPLPLGLLGTLQAAVFNSTSQVIGLTAAFEFTVVP